MSNVREIIFSLMDMDFKRSHEPSHQETLIHGHEQARARDTDREGANP